MIFKRLTSIALIAALSVPSTLMAMRINHYYKEADSEGRPLIPLTSSTATAGETLREPSTSGTNTFLNVPLETSSSTAAAQPLRDIESQLGPNRKPFQCTTERINCVVGCVGYSLAGLLIVGVIAEILTFFLFSTFPSDPCAHQTLTLDTTTNDFTFAPATTSTSGRGRTDVSLHHYQKRRGGSSGRGGFRPICPPASTRSSSTFGTTLLSNFYDLTSESTTASTGTQSTTSDNTPPPLVHQSQE